MNVEELRNHVTGDARPAAQYAIILICFAITVLDGFDILAISFVAPVLAREWHLEPVQLGLVFSAGLAGMAAGALLLSPLGDIFGRRKAILLFLALIGTGMLLTAFAATLAPLALFRFLTGLGIGGMVSNTGTTILEFVGRRRRTAALSLVMVGTPIGALVSGSVALSVIDVAGWEAVFLTGGALTLLLIPLAYFAMPESVEFLLERRPPDALARLNRVMRMLRLDPLVAMPAAEERAGKQRVGLASVFGGRMFWRTVAIGLIHLFYMYSYYAFVNWTAEIITQLDQSTTAGISVAMLINLGGIAGALLVGAASLRLSLTHTTAFGFVAIGVALVAFGLLPGTVWGLGFVAAVAGVAFFGTQVSLYSYAAASYPAAIRATAIGLAFSIGRVGSILGPYAAGLLIQQGVGRGGLFAMLAVPPMLAAILVMRARHQYATVSAPV